MHFPIIAIEKLDIPAGDWTTNLDYEDRCLLEHTDYYGDIYAAENRKKVITSDWLKELFAGIATIDSDVETITFLSEQDIRLTIQAWFEEETKRLNQMAKAGRCRAYNCRCAGEEFRGYWTLFYNCTDSSGYGYGQTSMDFVEDSVYLAGKTYKIGNIFDAHI